MNHRMNRQRLCCHASVATQSHKRTLRFSLSIFLFRTVSDSIVSKCSNTSSAPSSKPSKDPSRLRRRLLSVALMVVVRPMSLCCWGCAVSDERRRRCVTDRAFVLRHSRTIPRTFVVRTPTASKQANSTTTTKGCVVVVKTMMTTTTATDGNESNKDETIVALSAQLEQTLVTDEPSVDFQQITTTTTTTTESKLPPTPVHTIVCDAGFGFPSEAKPRKEKILAISRQLINFLCWQQQHQHQHRQQDGGYDAQKRRVARVLVVGRDEESNKALKERMEVLWTEHWKGRTESTVTVDATGTSSSLPSLPPASLPSNVEFRLTDALNETEMPTATYLSPDATEFLNPSGAPPGVVVVGMIIDRRVQINRSLKRSAKLEIPAARLPLHCIGIDDHEPLNVDTVLEAMQQWYWNDKSDQTNSEESTCRCGDDGIVDKGPFMRAMQQAMAHHYERHPNRKLHGTSSSSPMLLPSTCR